MDQFDCKCRQIAEISDGCKIIGVYYTDCNNDDGYVYWCWRVDCDRDDLVLTDPIARYAISLMTYRGKKISKEMIWLKKITMITQLKDSKW